MLFEASITFLGYCSGIAAGDSRCSLGPFDVQKGWLTGINSKLAEKFNPFVGLEPLILADKTDVVAQLCQRLAQQVQLALEQKQRFCVIGGDHSSAIGTWSGVKGANPHHSLGLIWIDAHLDSHTHETSDTQNIHGMPVAALLGQGDTRLTSILGSGAKILPENLVLIGIRSYESKELELIRRLGVRVYFIDEVIQRGIESVMAEALHCIRTSCDYYGLSVDLDGFDPADAPGVGTPVAQGVSAQEFIKTLAYLSADEKFVGLEIAEFNPILDTEFKTREVIFKLINQVFG